MADELFGKEASPKAIILTHGHFDKQAVPDYGRYTNIPAKTEDLTSNGHGSGYFSGNCWYFIQNDLS